MSAKKPEPSAEPSADEDVAKLRLFIEGWGQSYRPDLRAALDRLAARLREAEAEVVRLNQKYTTDMTQVRRDWLYEIKGLHRERGEYEDEMQEER